MTESPSIFYIGSDWPWVKDVYKYQNIGALVPVKEIGSQQGRPSYAYGYKDIRLAIERSKALDLDDFLKDFVFQCPACQNYICTDQEEIFCFDCKNNFERSTATSAWQHCGGALQK